MTSRLEELLESIDPEKTIDEINMRLDDALNAFPYARGTIEGYAELEDYLARFVHHLDRYLLRVKGVPFSNPDFYYGRALRALTESYGEKGEHLAFTMANTGVEGGLYAVLKTIGAWFAAFYSGNHIRVLVHEFTEQLSPEEVVAAASEYREKYRSMLPAEIQKQNPAVIAMKFREILERHPDLVRQMRNLIR